MASRGSNESPQGDNTSAHSHVSYDNRTLMFCISSIATKRADAHPITIKKLAQNNCICVHLGSRPLHRNTPVGLLGCDHTGTHTHTHIYIYMHIYRYAYHWTNVWILYHPWLPVAANTDCERQGVSRIICAYRRRLKPSTILTMIFCDIMGYWLALFLVLSFV